MSAPRLLIRGGTVYTSAVFASDVHVEDVLIVDGVIERIAPRIVDAEAEVIDAAGCIVMPGLIDTHRHLWQTGLRGVAADWTMGQYVARIMHGIAAQFEPEDVRIAGLVGSLEAIDAGTTTLMDWSHIVHSPGHADAAIEGLAASGVRGIYGYGLASMPVPEWFEDDLRRLVEDDVFRKPGSRLQLWLASWGPEFADIAVTAGDLELARKLGLRTSMHVGVGILGAARAVSQLDERDLLGPDIEFVHANTVEPRELRRIAETGGAVSVSPRVEMQMGHGFPATGVMIEQGLRPSLSVDTVTAVPGTIFSEMRAALEAERARQNDLALADGRWPASLDLISRDVVAMATINGARALGLESLTGSLEPGKQADLVILRGGPLVGSTLDSVAGAIISSDAADVRDVIVAGDVLKREGRIVSHDLDALVSVLAESREKVLAATAAAAVSSTDAAAGVHA